MSTSSPVSLSSDDALGASILAARWGGLVAKIESDEACRRGWEIFDQRMREFTGEKLAELHAKAAGYQRNRREHGGAKIFTWTNFLRFMAREAMELAFHHRLSGHEASRVAAEDLLQLIMDADRWQTIDPKRGWRSDLWTSEVTAGSAMAILLLGDALDGKRKGQWEELIFARGIKPAMEDWLLPGTRIHALDTMGHNWWSVCVPCAALGLLASGRKTKETEDWLHRIGDGLVEFFNYPGNVLENKKRSFGAQGDFIEPVGYLDYALLYVVALFDFYPACVGRDLASEIPVLGRLADYCLASVEVLKKGDDQLAFGDASKTPLGDRLISWMWFANRFRNEPLFHFVRRNRPEPLRFFEFLHWPVGLTGEGFHGAPMDVVFEQIGEGILRDGYDLASTVFAIKTGEAWNHNHMDAGSFTISSAGRHFLIDSGTCEYSNRAYLNYFVMPEAHNLVVPGGFVPDAQVFHLGTKHEGKIPCHLFAPGYKYLLADATGPWEGIYRRFYRHVLWIGGFIVLVDDLMTWQKPDRWTQLLHHAGTAVSDGRTTRIENEGDVLTIHHVAPVFTGVETRIGCLKVQKPAQYKDEQEMCDVPYFALHREGIECRQKFVQVFALPGKPLDEVAPIETGELSGAKVSQGETTWEIYCNHLADGRRMNLNSYARIGDFTTDAFILVLRRDARRSLTAVAMHHGSSLTKGGDVIFNSLLKGNILMDCNEAVLHSYVSAEAWADFRLPDGPASSSSRMKLPAGATKIRL